MSWEVDKMTSKDFKILQKIIDKDIEREIQIKKQDKIRREIELGIGYDE
jgi:hypothetical protein